jgi:hypothetical protein
MLKLTDVPTDQLTEIHELNNGAIEARRAAVGETEAYTLQTGTLCELVEISRAFSPGEIEAEVRRRAH